MDEAVTQTSLCELRGADLLLVQMRDAESVPKQAVSCTSPVPLKTRDFCGAGDKQRWGWVYKSSSDTINKDVHWHNLLFSAIIVNIETSHWPLWVHLLQEYLLHEWLDPSAWFTLCAKWVKNAGVQTVRQRRHRPVISSIEPVNPLLPKGWISWLSCKRLLNSWQTSPA